MGDVNKQDHGGKKGGSGVGRPKDYVLFAQGRAAGRARFSRETGERAVSIGKESRPRDVHDAASLLTRCTEATPDEVCDKHKPCYRRAGD
jgi:hypothetical protein